jgi:hypothetical protein
MFVLTIKIPADEEAMDARVTNQQLKFRKPMKVLTKIATTTTHMAMLYSQDCIVLSNYKDIRRSSSATLPQFQIRY